MLLTLTALFFFDFSSPLLSARKKNDRVSNDVLRDTLCIGKKITYLWFVSNIVSLPYGLLVARAFFIFLDKINSAVAISGCTHKNDLAHSEINIRTICYSQKYNPAFFTAMR